MGDRFLIATGTTSYPDHPDLTDLPELQAEIANIQELFAGAPGSLGYRRVPGFKADLSSVEIKRRLREFMTADSRTSDDVVVFYYTGHGELDESGEFLLPFRDTTQDIAGTAVPASELARWLLIGTPVQRLLVILDTCHAGAAATEMARRAAAALSRIGGLTNRPQFAILAATRPREQASPAAFTEALIRAVRHRASGGHEPRFLSLDAVIDVINADPEKPAFQHAQMIYQTEVAAEFLPNPRYNQWLRGLDLRTQLDHEQRLERDRDFRDHLLPRAQGLDTPQEGVWLFTGRHAALRDLCQWLRRVQEDGTTRVITGAPGSGKSAVLGRLTVLARPDHLRKVPRSDQLPPDTLPPRGSIDVSIHARGRTGDQVLAALCSAAGVEAERPGELLVALADRPHPFVAFIDALDEATDPDHLADKILAPLIRGAPHSKLRLALGTRRHLIERLAGPTLLLDLDSDVYADPASIRAYAQRCLLDLVPESPYRDISEPQQDAVANAVADAAGQSFLVALITSRSLAMRSDVANPYDAQWRNRLPRLAADAMRLDLDQRLGELAVKARDLLRPLAYALGTGLPWEDVWAPLASALSGRQYTGTDLDWLVREAGFYIIESLAGTRSVYRLYHEALSEHLRSTGNAPRIHHQIVTFFRERSPKANDLIDWARAHPYCREHLATHAAAAGVLDDLVLDPSYLLNARRAPLLAALSATRTPDGQSAAQAYRRTIKHLRTKPSTDHAAYLELAAHCHQAEVLARQIVTQNLYRPWRTIWAQWVSPNRDATLYGHNDEVRAIAIGELDERPVVVSASDDGTARVWDLASGNSIGKPFTGHKGSVRAVAVGRIGERPVAVSGGVDYTVHVWDLATGAALKGPFLGHQHDVRAVSIGDFDDQLVLVTGSYDNTIRVWDLATGKPVRPAFRGHHGGIVAVAATNSTWRPVVISAAADGTARVWDLLSGGLIHTLSNKYRTSILAMAVAEIDQRVMVTTSGVIAATSLIQTWDLATGTPRGRTIKHVGSHARSVALGNTKHEPIVVTGHNDGSIRVWSLAEGELLVPPFIAHDSVIYTLAVSQLDDTPVLVSGGQDRSIKVWDLYGQQTTATAQGAHLSGLRAVVAGKIGGATVLVTAGDDKTIRMWDPHTGSPIGVPFAGHTDRVQTVAIGNLYGQQVVISGSDDRTVRLWDVDFGDQVPDTTFRHGSPVRAVAFTEVEGRPIVVSGGQDNTVKVWDPRTGENVTEPLAAFLYPVLAIAVGRPTGRVVTVEDRSRQEPLWGPPMYRVSYEQPYEATLIAQFAELGGETTLISGDHHGELRLWKLTKPRSRSVFPPRSALKLMKTVTGDRPITAMTHHRKWGIVIARMDSIELTRADGTTQTIQLDAEITAMTFTEPDKLIAATKQGLAALVLSDVDSLDWAHRPDI